MLTKISLSGLIISSFVLAAVSDVVWQALIAGVVAVALGWIQMKTKDAVDKGTVEAKASATETKIAVQEVKETLADTTAVTDKKLNEIVETGQLTHDLVNSASLVQLRLYAGAVRRIADITKDKKDAETATAAEKLLQEHEVKAKEATAKHTKE